MADHLFQVNWRAGRAAHETFFLGDYRIVDEIGLGGMASVYLARLDRVGGFQKWAAVKSIHPHLTTEASFIQMFLDEARVAARISHPNVATIFDLGKENNTYWIAMEYLHGEPLRELMHYHETHNVTMTPQIACKIIVDAAEGLHAAHEIVGINGEKLGLVHRDVTPHNLFVTYDGSTKVVDFGIAKFASRHAVTRAGILKGKLAYMSPEQGLSENVDRRTDIFALGVVLWELTTGKRLFRMENELETLAKVQECHVPPPSSIIPNYPLDLEKIVLKALNKDRSKRFETSKEFSRALQSLFLHRGWFVTSDEVSSYMQLLFKERIKKRDEHLRWAAEVSEVIQTGKPKKDGDKLVFNLAPKGSEKPSSHSLLASKEALASPTSHGIPSQNARNSSPSEGHLKPIEWAKRNSYDSAESSIFFDQHLEERSKEEEQPKLEPNPKNSQSPHLQPQVASLQHTLKPAMSQHTMAIHTDFSKASSDDLNPGQNIHFKNEAPLHPQQVATSASPLPAPSTGLSPFPPPAFSAFSAISATTHPTHDLAQTEAAVHASQDKKEHEERHLAIHPSGHVHSIKSVSISNTSSESHKVRRAATVRMSAVPSEAKQGSSPRHPTVTQHMSSSTKPQAFSPPSFGDSAHPSPWISHDLNPLEAGAGAAASDPIMGPSSDSVAFATTVNANLFENENKKEAQPSRDPGVSKPASSPQSSSSPFDTLPPFEPVHQEDMGNRRFSSPFSLFSKSRNAGLNTDLEQEQRPSSQIEKRADDQPQPQPSLQSPFQKSETKPGSDGSQSSLSSEPFPHVDMEKPRTLLPTAASIRSGALSPGRKWLTPLVIGFSLLFSASIGAGLAFLKAVNKPPASPSPDPTPTPSPTPFPHPTESSPEARVVGSQPMPVSTSIVVVPVTGSTSSAQTDKLPFPSPSNTSPELPPLKLPSSGPEGNVDGAPNKEAPKPKPAGSSSSSPIAIAQKPQKSLPPDPKETQAARENENQTPETTKKERGTLTIVCFPACDMIFDNGVAVGNQLLGAEVAAGRHTVRMVRGSASVVKSTTVMPGTLSRITHNFGH